MSEFFFEPASINLIRPEEYFFKVFLGDNCDGQCGHDVVEVVEIASVRHICCLIERNTFSINPKKFFNFFPYAFIFSQNIIIKKCPTGYRMLKAL